MAVLVDEARGEVHLAAVDFAHGTSFAEDGRADVGTYRYNLTVFHRYIGLFEHPSFVAGPYGSAFDEDVFGFGHT